MKAVSTTTLALALMMGAAASLSTPALAAEQRTLSMGGHGEAKAAPDLVSINAGVTTSAPTAAAALSANTTRMKGVFAALTRLGVPEKNIQTVNFSVSPQYANNRENNEAPRVTGYQVNNQVSVLLEDVSRLGGALDALVTAGANQMHGINFSIKEPAPLLAKARADAIADAKLRAETYARAAGVTLGPIQSISESGGVVMPYRADRMMMASAPKAVPVAAGEESVTADVSVVWEIK